MKAFLKSILLATVAIFGVASCEDVPAPYLLPGMGEAQVVTTVGEGTYTNPYTASDAVALVKANQFDENAKVFIKGIIVSLGDENGSDMPGNSYGNATYFISDDGTPTKEVEVFRGYGLGGEKITTEDYLKVGDQVVIRGTLSLYGSKVEVATGSEIYQLNDQIVEFVELGESKGSGTWEDPWNVPAAIRTCEGLEKSSSSDSYPTGDVYVKGIVAEVVTDGSNAWSQQYGNITYFISEDGTSNNKLEVYRGLGLGGNKFTSQEDLKPGDVVVVFGQLVNFNGTYEFTSGNYLVQLNDEVVTPPDYSSATGDGTLQNPYNPVAALQVCSQLEKTTSNNDRKLSDEVYIRGVVTSVVSEGTNAWSSQYANLTYFISETGNEEEQKLEVFRGMGLGNTPFASQDALKPGDKVVICGQLINYNGTFEVNQGNYLVELNGQRPVLPDYSTAAGSGTQDDPFNVVGAMQLISTLEKTTSTQDMHTSQEVYTRGVITRINEVSTTSNTGNATYFIADVDATGAPSNDPMELEIYRGYYINGEKFTSADQIKVGDQVVVFGKLVNYNGTFEYTTGSRLVSINGEDTPVVPPSADEKISVEGNIVTITNPDVEPMPGDNGTTYDLNELIQAMQIGNAKEVSEITTNDGVVISFGQGSNAKDAPKYYTGTKGVRMYTGNTMTITNMRQRRIAQVVLQCDQSTTAAYTGNPGKTATFEYNSMTIANEGTGTTHLRVQTVTVFYGAN